MFGKSVWQAVLLAVCGTFGVTTANVARAAEPLTLEQALADDVRLDAILHDVKKDLMSQSAGWWHRGGCFGYGYGCARPYAFGCFRAPLCYRAPICYTPVVSYCSYPVFNCYPTYNCGFGYGGFGYGGYPYGVGYGGIYGGFSSFGISSFGYSNSVYRSGYSNAGYSNYGYSNVSSPNVNSPNVNYGNANYGNVNYGNVNYANSRSPAPRVTNYQTAPQSVPQSVAPAQRPIFNFASYAPAKPAPRAAAVPAIYGGCYYW